MSLAMSWDEWADHDAVGLAALALWALFMLGGG